MGPELVFVVYGLSLLVLSTFGLNRYILVTYFRRRQRHETVPQLPESELPTVTIQLPIYNELYVVERLIRSACEVDYPRQLLEIQVLDDSTDETLELARSLVSAYRARGVDIVHIHREDRTGFKGGALGHGLERARGEFVAVFDADFVIPRGFLRDVLPHFTSDDVGMVQTRWTYLNDDYSMLTRAAALGLDGHFVVEQSARYWGGLFMNFNGTAGVWRARCIHDAGGWQHDTLTEDLDLSYRAQIAGWRFKYLWDVTCESEIPAEIHGMKAQQFRWTKGSMETARKMLPRLWRADLGMGKWAARWIKLQGTLHLIGNIVFPFFLTVGLLNLPIVLVSNEHNMRLLWPVSAYFLFTLFGTFSYYWTAQKATNMDWRRRAAYFPLFLGASIGLGVYNTQAAIEGLFGKKSPFVRTPKYSMVGKRRGWLDKRYRSPVTWSFAGELALGIYTVATIVVAVRLQEYGALPFLCLFAFGYLVVATYSLKHMITGRRVPVARLTVNAAGAAVAASPALAGVDAGQRFHPASVGSNGRFGVLAGATPNGREVAPRAGGAKGHPVAPLNGRAAAVAAPGTPSGRLPLVHVANARATQPAGPDAGNSHMPPGALNGHPAGEDAGTHDRRPREAPIVQTLSLLFVLLSLGCDGVGDEEGRRTRSIAEIAASAAVGFPRERPEGFEELALVEKGQGFDVVPVEAGGAQGVLWYTPAGEPLEWFVRAESLAPLRAYRLLLNVDGTKYAIASLVTDPQGVLRGYGTLEAFREQICVPREEYDEPLPLAGTHELRVWIQDDGARTGSRSSSGVLPMQAKKGGPSLPCSGNGDGSYDFRLMEAQPIQFHGG